MKAIHQLKLGILLICLSSCKGIELDIYNGNANGYIENAKQEKVFTNQREFNEYGCMHVDEYARLAIYIKRHCNSK